MNAHALNPNRTTDPTGLQPRATGALPPEGMNTIVCDGKGGITDWLDMRDLTIREQQCAHKCAKVHEMVHARDSLALDPNVCKDQPFGSEVALAPGSERLRNEDEYRAYKASAACFRREPTTSSAARLKCCKDYWERFAEHDEYMRDLYHDVLPPGDTALR